MEDRDVRAQLYFEANKKSQGAAYLLWFFLGGFGAHRFYLGRTGSAVAQLMLGLLGWIPLFLGWMALGIWWIIDAILIPDMIRQDNMELANKLIDPYRDRR